MISKCELRQQIRQRKRQADSIALSQQSLAISQHLMNHPRWMSAHTILLYHALPDEVCLERLLGEYAHKRLLLPIVVGDELELGIFDGRVSEGAFGIMEPVAASSDPHLYASIDLALVPGMAFDSLGHRLGRGKGYYDKLFARMPEVYKIGVCFDFQLLDYVPCEAHDVVMDEVVCE